jgi:predicted permease
VLWLLFSAILGVLATACANVGYLLLLSVQARRREFALRAALGARPTRLARLVLSESAVLSVVGGAAGLVAAPWFLRAFLSAYPADLPIVGEIVLSPLALAAIGAATLASAAALAVPPLVAARATNLTEPMRATTRGSDSRGQRGARAVLVIGQVAMSTTLLVGGVLLLHTFADIRATPLGFAPQQVLTFNIALAEAHYPALAAETAFHRNLAERIRAIPGVTATGTTTLLPLSAGDTIDRFSRPGHPDDVYPDLPSARLQVVTPGYIEAMGLARVSGRLIDVSDAEGGAPIVVVNETLQRRYFPEGALGRQIHHGGAVREIVGVVADKRHRSLREEARAELYVPRAQATWPRWFAWVAVRHTGNSDTLVAAARAAVRDLDPRVALDGIGTMTDRVDRALAPDRFRAFLVGALAVVAVGLAMIGVYGLVAQAVAREARDTAIRMALGARASRAAGRVLTRVLVLTAAGVSVGLAGAFLGRELVATFVVGATGGDGWTMGVVACGVLGLATVAASGPALRASRVDPARVLRSE